MPSGKTHDAVTILFAAPMFLAAWRATNNFGLALLGSAAFLFGGLMFGPDLDTQSVEYRRWGVFRFFWFPYKVFFAHRSRWSHGLVFGTMMRVIYFAGVTTVFFALIFYFAALLRNAAPPTAAQIRELWETFGLWTREHVGNHAIFVFLAGLWAGAACHTLTDIIGTFIKTGKVKGFL